MVASVLLLPTLQPQSNIPTADFRTDVQANKVLVGFLDKSFIPQFPDRTTDHKLADEYQAKKDAEAKAIQDAKIAEEARQAQLTAQQAYTAPTPVYGGQNGYTYGQCTWYIANRRSVPMWGNARNWLYNAQAQGWATGSTPQVGAIAWTGAGYAGHVAYVEQVAGSQVLVSEANYLGVGVISQRWANAWDFQYIY